jgi:hypothetical protein
MFKKGIKVMFVGFLDERKLRIFFLPNVRIYEKLRGGKSDYKKTLNVVQTNAKNYEKFKRIF